MTSPAVGPALRDLLSAQRQGFQITKKALRLNSPELATIELAQTGLSKTIESADKDFFRYCASLHTTLDADGNKVFKPFADLNKYWSEMRSLTVERKERQAKVGERFRNGTFKLDYDPRLELLEFLRSTDRSSKRFLRLKQDHFEITLALLLDGKGLLAVHESICRKFVKAKPYCDAISLILAKALIPGDGLIGRAVRFLRTVPIDAVEAAQQVEREQGYVHDLQGMLAARGNVAGNVGLPHLLDCYRRQCEALRVPIAALAEAVSIVEGRPSLGRNPGYGKCVERIRESHPTIVACLDPDIRNSESHGGTVIDHDKGTITLTKLMPNGTRTLVRTYTYWEFSDMANDLQHGLLMALTLEIAMQEIAVLSVMLHTQEYCELLLSIDNLQGHAPDGRPVP